MSLYEELRSGDAKLSLVGLGYVGMPIAVEFSKHVKVIGYDCNEEKIAKYKDGLDPTNEVGDEAVLSSNVEFTSDSSRLEEAKFHIVAVPTPVNQDKTPDLTPVEGASRTLGRHLKSGSIVVYESTVYPGVTEDVCVPILEQESGLKCGVDFKVGYSPERINPGDRVHTLTTIRKVVSGMDEECLNEIKNVYDIVIEAGTYPVSTIKTAEAIKVVENSQRDINIAFMNELAMVFDRMGIDTSEVVDGMNTKWNALGFRPGLVGGHCIGVDPYYFTYEAEKLGYHSQIILAGRKVNDGMGEFVADAAIREMVQAGLAPAKAKVGVLGITFKEDCPDVRNSKVEDILKRFREYGITPLVSDPWADSADASRAYGVTLVGMDEMRNLDCLVVAVAHKQFKEMTVDGYKALFAAGPNNRKVLVDVKSILERLSSLTIDIGDYKETRTALFRSQNMNEQISVIMPVYNKGKYIHKAINSVLAQKQVSVELICVDDGSTDDSVEVIERFRSKDARIQLIRQANAGAGAARNVGLEHSSAEYVSFLDPDDWYPDDNVLSRLYEGASKSGCKISMGKRLFYVRPFVFKRTDNLFSEGIHNCSELSSAFLYQSCIFKRSFIVENHIQFPSYRRFQDPPFFLRAMIAAGSFYFSGSYAHCYRRGIQKIAWNDKKLLDYICGTFDSLSLAESVDNYSIFLQVLGSLNNASFTEGVMNANSELAFKQLGKIELYARRVLGDESYEIRAMRLKRSTNPIRRSLALCSLRIENGVKSVF